MNGLRHNHISGDVEPVPLARSFDSSFEDVASRRPTQTWRTPVATKPEKVQTPRFLKSLETPRHKQTIVCRWERQSGSIEEMFLGAFRE
jgi:hypothetical protein